MAKSEFAPGLPDPKLFGNPKDLPINKELLYVVQKHLAQRAGLHFDTRFGRDAGRKPTMLSWASRKLPEVPGQKTMAFQQPLHTGAYAPFEGKILSGYGKGTVTTHDKGAVLITKAEKDKINFVVTHKKHPETFTLVRKSGPPTTGTGRTKKTQGGSWLMINTTPTDVIKHKKVKYSKVDQKDVEKLFDPEYLHMEKIDGACFPGAIKVLTDRGWVAIREIVKKRLPVKVASMTASGKLVWRRVTNYWKHRKSTDPWVSFRAWAYPRKPRYVACTAGHEILTPQGKRAAGDLCVGDTVYVYTTRPSQLHKELLLGGLLGDGCLRKDGSFQFDQTYQRRSFVKWLHWAFCGVDAKLACYSDHEHGGSGYGDFGAARMKTSRMYKTTRERLYRSGTKEFASSDLVDLSPLALAVWFAGDGTVGYRKDGRINYAAFHTDGFSLETVQALRHELLLQYALKTRIAKKGIRKDGGQRYTIELAPRATRQLFRLIAPWLHPVFGYKLRGAAEEIKQKIGCALPSLDFTYKQGFAESKIDLIRHTAADRGQYGNNQFVYDLEVEGTHNYIAEGVVVSNSALYKLFSDKIEILSYRPTTTGKPIIHSYRVGGTTGLNIPKHLVGSILRGELYGARDNAAIPPQELGGLLNSSTQKSREKQRDQKVELRSVLFNILRYGKNEDISVDQPIAGRLDKVKEVLAHLPADKFHLPRMAETPEEQKKMWEDISGGKNSLTHEGIVAWPKAGGKPTKVKLYEEHDVHVKDIFPGKKGLAGVGAGGFSYSLNPGEESVGEVGSGFTQSTREQMLQSPEDFIGRIARIRAQEQFPSGAYRAPSFLALHEDYSKAGGHMIIQPLIKKATANSCATLDELVKHAFFGSPEPSELPAFMQPKQMAMPEHLRKSLGIAPAFDFRSKFLSYLTGQKPQQTDDLLAALKTLSRISGFFRGTGRQDSL